MHHAGCQITVASGLDSTRRRGGGCGGRCLHRGSNEHVVMEVPPGCTTSTLARSTWRSNLSTRRPWRWMGQAISSSPICNRPRRGGESHATAIVDLRLDQCGQHEQTPAIGRLAKRRQPTVDGLVGFEPGARISSRAQAARFRWLRAHSAMRVSASRRNRPATLRARQFSATTIEPALRRLQTDQSHRHLAA